MIIWEERNNKTQMGFYKDKPLFYLYPVGISWEIFLSGSGKIKGTLEECKKWANNKEQIKIADFIIACRT